MAQFMVPSPSFDALACESWEKVTFEIKLIYLVDECDSMDGSLKDSFWWKICSLGDEHLTLSEIVNDLHLVISFYTGYLNYLTLYFILVLSKPSIDLLYAWMNLCLND